jgi:glycosyltransferase involved in cell wall biosynthesis
MNYYIIIPAHNEAALIGLTLESLVTQTLLPKKIVIVNDNSTDNTADIVLTFAKEHHLLLL